MGSNLEISIKDGICFLKGSLNEATDYSSIKKAPRPLKLNFRGIEDINSVGVRLFCIFISELKGEEYHYYECPPVFLEMLNMIPGLFPESGYKDVMHSMIIPYICSECEFEKDILKTIEEVKIDGEEIELPDYDCPDCKEKDTLEPSLPPEDLLFFMVS